jgi:hypothetical protein
VVSLGVDLISGRLCCTGKPLRPVFPLLRRVAVVLSFAVSSPSPSPSLLRSLGRFLPSTWSTALPTLANSAIVLSAGTNSTSSALFRRFLLPSSFPLPSSLFSPCLLSLPSRLHRSAMPSVESKTRLRVGIIGAGPAGLGALVALSKIEGVDVQAYEAARELREVGAVRPSFLSSRRFLIFPFFVTGHQPVRRSPSLPHMSH